MRFDFMRYAEAKASEHSPGVNLYWDCVLTKNTTFGLAGDKFRLAIFSPTAGMMTFHDEVGKRAAICYIDGSISPPNTPKGQAYAGE